MIQAALLQSCGLVIDEPDLTAVSEEDVAAWNAYDAIMHDAAPETPFELPRYAVRYAPPACAVRLFVARDPQGRVVADARVVVPESPHERHRCHAQIGVRPDWRGRGLGTILLQRIADAADTAHRTVLVGWTSDRAPAGERFVRGLRGSAVHTHRLATLRLSDVAWGMVDRWIAEAAERAADYELIRFDGPYQEALLDTMARWLRLVETVRLGGFDLNGLDATVDALRRRDENGLAEGRWTLVARHTPTGALVGFTEVFSSCREPAILQQTNTAVEPDHRGRGLCKWMKAAMLARVRRERPDIAEIRTANFGSNAAMLAVNAALGFTPCAEHTAWQVPVDAVREPRGQTDHPHHRRSATREENTAP